MEIRIFYSWQSDLPNFTNRGFIEKALEQAAKTIHSDETFKVEPVIDRDTAGVPGSPDIASTIFSKIEQAHIFVCDVSIINTASEGRKTPNPNVLIELGYAMKVLGPTRIIMVLNEAYGGIELLPFDLRLKRVTHYNMHPSETDRASERNKLGNSLKEALRVMLTTETLISRQENKVQIAEQVRHDIENSAPGQIVSIRKFMKWLTNEINTLAPVITSNEERDELVVASIAKSENIVFEFANVAEVIAAMDSETVAEELFKNFKPILENYRPQGNFSGTYYPSDFDYYKFLGHELFVCLISPLIKDGRWNIITKLLEKGIYINNKTVGQPGIVYFDYFSRHLDSLEHRKNRLKLNRVSVHADIINERHTKGILAETMPMENFLEADFFLFLRAGLNWRAWSTIYLGDTIPQFLVEAASEKYVQNLFNPLKVDSIPILKERIIERVKELRQLFRPGIMFFPLGDFDLRTIGSQS